MTDSSALIRPCETPAGLARLHLFPATGDSPRAGTIVLGHGAGGSGWSADLVALTQLRALGWLVVLVEQPWRVAGKKVAPAPPTLDRAWLAAVAQVRTEPEFVPGHLILGGRSAGARVVVRTSCALGADAVLALAFPLHPPGKPESSRASELDDVRAAALPLLIVQGERDPFGTPSELAEVIAAGSARGTSANNGAAAAHVRLVPVPGGHGFDRCATGVFEAVSSWVNDVWA